MLKYIPFLFITACSTNVQEYKDHTVINYHGGGTIYEVMDDIKHYKKPIYIKGLCASSCTYVFNYADTCVSDDATIMLHAPRNMDGAINPHWFKIMSNWYPQALKQWFDTVAIDGQDYYFTGRQFKQIFNIGACNDSQ